MQAVDLFEEEDEGRVKEPDGDLDNSDHSDLALLILYLDLKYDMIMMLLPILTKPHPIFRLEVCHYDDDDQDEDVDFDEDNASPPYLLFVTDTTDGICVKKIARCKFLQI